MKKNTYYGTGRRKGAVAKVNLVNGTGKITVNGKDVHEYFPFETLVMDLSQPLEITQEHYLNMMKQQKIAKIV